MSNHARLNPYTDDRPEQVSVDIVGEVLRDLGETLARTDTEQAALDRYKEMARRDLISGLRVDARLADNGDLLRAAQALGYKQTSAASSPHLLELAGPGGTALLIRRAGDHLNLVSNRRDAIFTVVRHCTLERAVSHLSRVSGGQVMTKKLANGEVELKAVDGANTAAPAAVTVKVTADGSIDADISCHGDRCDALLSGLADAVASRVTSKTLKQQYYAPVAPGEPTLIKPGA